MESSIKPNCSEDDDIDSLETIKLHDRFISNSYNDDDEEFFSDDNDNANECTDNAPVCKTGCFSTHEFDYCSMMSSEAKAKTLSMLDSVRSSCRRSSQNFTLDVLNMKSDESGLNDPVCRMLGEALYCCPPFGDPPSEVDLLNSALSLLEEGSEMSKKFREVECMDGCVMSDAEKLVEADGRDYTYLEPSAMLVDLKTPQNIASVLEEPEVNMEKKEITVSSSVTQELTENISPNLQLNCNEEPRCARKDMNLLSATLETNEKVFPSGSQVQTEQNTYSKKANHKKRSNGNGPVKNVSIGKDLTPISLCVEDESKSDNQDTEKNVSCPKENQDLPAPVMSSSNVKKPGKTKGKKCDVSSSLSFSLSASTKNEINVSSKEETVSVRSLDHAQSTICNVNCVLPQDLKAMPAAAEISLSEPAVAENEEEFTVVLSRKKSRSRKDANAFVDAIAADVLPKSKTNIYSRVNCCGVSNSVTSAYASLTLSISSRLASNSAKNPHVSISKQLPSSSLSESSSIVTKTSGKGDFFPVENTSEHLTSVDSFCNESVTSISYASVLSQHLSYSCGKQAATILSDSDVERNKSVLSVGPEMETDGFLSPPQSEADTGFSSSSSLSPDETQPIALCTVADRSLERKAEAELVEHTFSSQDALPLNTVSCKTVDKDCVGSSNLDMKLSERCLKLERNVQENNDICCKKQSKSPRVFFDTRKHRLADSTSGSDIIFGFNSGEEYDCSATNPNSASNFASSSKVTNADLLAFFAFAPDVSSDGEPEVKLDFDKSLNSGEFRNITEKTYGSRPLLSEKSSLQTDTRVTTNMEFKNDELDAIPSTPIYDRFDLYAAQNFLSKAFQNILKLEGPDN